jgi:hypothetical protein
VTISVALAADGAAARERQVQAAFLFNFLKYVEWPVASPPRPFGVAVLGKNPFDERLMRAMAERRVGGRPVETREIGPYRDGLGFEEIDVLFLPSTEDARLDAVFAAIDRRPILTVGESRDFLARGGMLRFVLVEDQVRFEIDRAAVEAAGLKMSSKLLNLATRVVDEREPSR